MAGFMPAISFQEGRVPVQLDAAVAPHCRIRLKSINLIQATGRAKLGLLPLTSAPILHLKEGRISANVRVGKTRQKPVLGGQIRLPVLKDQISDDRGTIAVRGICSVKTAVTEPSRSREPVSTKV